MVSFTVTVPGKIILFGEHAVVYGKTAIAASLDLRSSNKFKVLPDSEYVHIEMLKLDLVKDISMTSIRENLLTFHDSVSVEDSHNVRYRRTANFVREIGYNSAQEKASLECLFYALLQSVQEDDLHLEAFSMDLDTELSIGAGVGSSASFAVCIVAAFYYWARKQKNKVSELVWEDSTLEKISRYAFNCERIMHGQPSGVDNTVCTFGSFIRFRKNELPHTMSCMNGMKILLVNTKVARSTKTLVDRLANLKTGYPEIFDKVLEAMDNVSLRAVKILTRMQDQSRNENDLLEDYKELSTLININQGLLSTCQVSHTSLDLICMKAEKYGFSAKLTGAGGGGFAYVLIPPNSSSLQVQTLSSELIKDGFSVTETNLGGLGLQVT